MEAKLKAKEIKDKYLKLLIKNIDISKPQSININQTAKDCALIEVNGIIETAPYYPHDGSFYELESDRLEKVKEYWTKVKEELEKL